MRGSWTSVIASLLYRKPLIVRTGYTWSRFVEMAKKTAGLDILSGLTERFSYRFAHAAIVASKGDAEYIKDKYNIAPSRVNVIGNFVDTELFKPLSSSRYRDRVVFVGRLTRQKNLFSLIKAVGLMPDIALDIYSNSDEMRQELEVLSRQCHARVGFKGKVDNDIMPQLLNSYEVFVLPSFYEGAPKALLEAMSCGLAVLGTNVEGIKEFVLHGENGWLLGGTDAESIRDGLTELLSNRSLIKRLQDNARQFIVSNFSLQSLVEKERLIIEGLKDGNPR
jgi:glycosyltransferase involved in cell wall biosynthesis